MGANPALRRLYIASLLFGMLVFAPSAGSVPEDSTPPQVTPVYSPSLPASGWFRGNVTLSWLVVDPESIIIDMQGCNVQTFSADTAGTPVTCTATSDGGTSSSTVKVKVDKTPPAVSAVPERVADANGWYNRPVTVSFGGTDDTSGIATCSPPSLYGGPDISTAAVVGSCADVAGNSTGASLVLKYDATAPTLFAVTAQRGNRSAQITWRQSSDTQTVEVLRAPGRTGEGQSVVYRGADTGFRDTGLVVGRMYEYRVGAVDQAANRSEQKIDLVATGALLGPAPGERVTAPPQLSWTPVKGADYYNVQLVRGRKVMSAWPAKPTLRLRRTWIYKGRRHRLRPGLYRWYVWPGFGRIAQARYGRLLGSSTFVVAG